MSGTEAYSREDCLQLTKVAEQAERYQDMVELMTKLVRMGGELSTEERNMLSVAYKNTAGARRSAWRIVSSVEQKKLDSDSTPEQLARIKKYREKIEKELKDICGEVLTLLDEFLIPSAAGNEIAEAAVFYFKMKGDYHRYQVEVSYDDKRQEATDHCQKAYEKATEAANTLNATNPIRLGLALNCSVFYFEILKSPEKACGLAKSAFDDAMGQLDALPEDSYKDATLIMQLLRDNLTLWTSEAEAEAGDE